MSCVWVSGDMLGDHAVGGVPPISVSVEKKPVGRALREKRARLTLEQGNTMAENTAPLFRCRHPAGLKIECLLRCWFRANCAGGE
ncbi:hypothetical protein GOBAR_AA06545 [Gossypium barbadense]|uniref:Uncharacterized protein n=1 Tax=Gossypium barbadense TaxID=3634 RepID=A0A2P5YEL4_GOSBA|nr:hypothetical protein GOBAR_AA06545 [Gossypium barbadense]